MAVADLKVLALVVLALMVLRVCKKFDPLLEASKPFDLVRMVSLYL